MFEAFGRGFFERREQRGIQRRKAKEGRHLMTPQQRQDCGRRQALRRENRRGAGMQGKAARVAQPVGEEHLRSGKHHVPGPDSQHPLAVEPCRLEQVAMPVQDALGPGGAARGVQPEADLVRSDRDRLEPLRHPGQRRPEREKVRISPTGEQHPRGLDPVAYRRGDALAD